MTRSLLVLGMITAVAYAARSFVRTGETITGSGAALAFGFLLIAAIQVGRVAEGFRSPQLTGYLLCGLVFGPEVLQIISRPMLDDLTLVKGTAVGLIALLAGCELNFRRLRPKLRAITALSLGSMLASAVLLTALFFLIVSILPATASFDPLERFGIALISANILAAFSPAVVIGLISETNARGPLSEITMSIVVLADLAIVVTFALTSSFVRRLFAPHADIGGMTALLGHIFGSIAAGLVFGVVLMIYIRVVKTRTALFVFAALFIAAEAGRILHLDPLLLGLAAGLFLENASPISGEEVVHSLESLTLPLFAIFFAVVGAELQLGAFLHVAPFALAAAAVRAFGISIGVRAVAKVAGVDASLARLIPSGLLSQAGVAIALAVLVLNDFPPWGRILGTVLLGSIVVNQLIGPILFRNALVRAGEVHAGERIEEPAPAAT